MEELQDDLKIYSEEVRDVLSAPPKSIFKWGNTILLVFILLLMFLSWFIKYPDIIRAEVVITTQFPPEKLVAKSSGRISKLFIENQIEIKENTPIAIIENAANYETVFLLKAITDTLKQKETFYFPLEKYGTYGVHVDSDIPFASDKYSIYMFRNDYAPFKYAFQYDCLTHLVKSELGKELLENGAKEDLLRILYNRIAYAVDESLMPEYD